MRYKLLHGPLTNVSTPNPIQKQFYLIAMNNFRLICSNDDHIYIDQPTKFTDTYYLKLNNGRKIGYYDVEKDYQGWAA